MPQDFPETFEIRILRTLYHNGRQEKGKVLQVPRDLRRDTAIRWCLRRRPLAEYIEPEKDNDKTDTQTDVVDDAVDNASSPAGTPESDDAPEVPEGHIDVATFDNPGVSIPDPTDEQTESSDATDEPGEPDASETTDVDLGDLTYQELQALAKERGIRANQGRDALLKALQ